MPRQRNNTLSTTNSQGNKIIQKENEKCPENKDMKECDLNYREFKISVPKKTQWDNKKIQKSNSTDSK